MKEVWFTPKELTTMEGMPTTIQGIHKKAKREGWSSRRKLGTQGPAVEYCLSPKPLSSGNGPAAVGHPTLEESLFPRYSKRTALQHLWLLIFKQLTDEQIDRLLTFFLQEGMMGLLESYRSLEVKKIANMIALLPTEQKTALIEQLESMHSFPKA